MLQMRTHIDIASIDVVTVVSVVLGVQLHTGALWLKRGSILHKPIHVQSYEQKNVGWGRT